MADFYIREGDTASDLADTLRDAAGEPVQINGAAVTLTLAPLRGGALIVDDAADNDDDGSLPQRGKVHYEWGAGETDDPGEYLGTWVVDFGGGNVQSYPNDGFILVSITPDPPTAAGRYLTREELKRTKVLQGTSHADEDIDIAIEAAAQGLDANYGGPWTLGSPGEARYFTPQHGLTYVRIPELQAITQIALDTAGAGAYNTVLAEGVDYVLEPAGGPWRRVRFLRSSTTFWGWEYPAGASPWPFGLDALRVTGTWGHDGVPAGVKAAATIIATRVLRRMREAPFGGIALGLEGAVVRATQLARDPEIEFVMKGPRGPRRLVV